MTAAPEIIIGQTDFTKLNGLGSAAEDLIAELDRAYIVNDNDIPANTVRMGSRLVYQPQGGDAKEVTLVYPGEADIDQGKISVTTPIGAAMIGMPAGASIEWFARNGKANVLTVLEVHALETA